MSTNETPLSPLAKHGPFIGLLVIGIINIALTAGWLGMWDHQRVTYYFWIFNTQALLFLAACILVINFDPDRRSFLLILAVAVILRLMLLPTEPAHSTDIFRYVWEGHVQVNGINPFRYFPAEPELAHLRDNYVYPNINRKEYAKTPYPPIAQIIFAISNLIRPLGVTTLKVIWVLLEGVTIAALLGILKKLKMNPARVLVYAWCPLAVWEISQNGHLDGGSATFIALTGWAAVQQKRVLTGIFLACATMIKLFPIVLFAAFWKKWDKKMPLALGLTLLIFYLPYLGVGTGILGFVTHYPSEEGFISGERYNLLRWIRMAVPLHPLIYLGTFVLAFGLIGLYLLWKHDKSELQQMRGATLLAGLMLLFLSPQYGWYYLWLLPFLAITIERVTSLQIVATLTIAAGFLRYHALRTLAPDMIVAPIAIGAALRQKQNLQWFWLLLLASTAWISWI